MSDRDPLADVLGESGVCSDRNADYLARLARDHIAKEIKKTIELMWPILPTEEGWAEGMSAAARIALNTPEREP